jgi:CBS domain-containing protein
MQRDLHTLGRNDKLSVADDVMRQGRIRHMPVLDDDGRLAGIISQRDLFRGALLRALGYGSRAEEMMLETVPVKGAMTEEVITTTPDTALATAAGLMLEHKVGCLPVLQDGRLVGILTESDFVRQAANA